MADANKGKPGGTGGTSEPGRAGSPSAREALGAIAQSAVTSTRLAETFAIDVQRQWTIAAEASVRIWGHVTRGLADLAVSTAALQLDAIQQGVDAMNRTAAERNVQVAASTGP